MTKKTILTLAAVTIVALGGAQLALADDGSTTAGQGPRGGGFLMAKW